MNHLFSLKTGFFKRFCITLLCMGLIQVNSLAQTWEWAHQTSGAMNLGAVRNINGLTTDGSGAALVCGYYSDTTSLGDKTFPGRGSVFSDAFVAKYSSDGSLMWAKRLYATSGGTTIIQSSGIACDAQANVYVVGTCAGTMTVESQQLSFGTFIAKYKADGSLIWAKNYGRIGAASITIDANGDVLVLGSFNGGTIDVGGQSLTGKGKDWVVAKLDSDGKVKWAKVATGELMAQTNLVASIKSDSKNNIIIAGSYSNSIDFGNGVSLNNGINIYDLFVAHYSPEGECQWARSAGSSSAQDQVRSLSIDADGNAYIMGKIGAAAKFDAITSTATGSSNAFIAKYNSAGLIQWVETVMNGQDCNGAIANDHASNVIIAGHFGGTLTIADSTFTSGATAFVAKYNSEGKALWATSPSVNLVASEGLLALDSKGSAFITGSFAGTMSFGAHSVTTGDNSNPLKSQMYVAKLGGIGSSAETLGVPVLVEPKSGTTVQTTSVTLRWDVVAGAVRYELQVSGNADFSGTLITSESSIGTTSYVQGGLSVGATYYWRVRAYSTSGSLKQNEIQSVSAWSQVFSFSVSTASDVSLNDGERKNDGLVCRVVGDDLMISRTEAFASGVGVVMMDMRGCVVSGLSVEHVSESCLRVDCRVLGRGVYVWMAGGVLGGIVIL